MTIASRKITDLETVSEPHYIYESPDGGKTVYKRLFGTSDRVLLVEDANIADRQKTAMRANRLMAILKLSQSDITLRDALEQLEALYILKYGDDKNN